MKEWLKSNFWEIKRSSSLQFFGTLLGLANILTYFYWQDFHNILTSKNHIPVICWNYLPQCQTEIINSGSISTIIALFIGSSVLATLFFNFQNLVGGAWFFLLIGFICKTILYGLDQSLSADVHILLFMLNAIVLFVPSKSLAVRMFIVIFYMASASFKLNTTWLSGYPLLETIGISNFKGLEWIAVFSMLIEASLPLFLLSKNWQYFFIGFLGLIAYHGFFLYVDNYFAPAIHLALLLFYLFALIEFKNTERRSMYQSYMRPEPTKAILPFVLLSFIAIQALPVVVPGTIRHPMNLAVAEAPRICDHYIVTKSGERAKFKEVTLNQANKRLRCHKQSFKSKALEICQDEGKVDSIQSIFFSANLLSTMFETFIEPLSCQQKNKQVKK